MIEPVNFGFNEQTAKNNFFQQKGDLQSAAIQASALLEFRAMVQLLLKEGVKVIVIQDTEEPFTPDSIFPNNWISFHAGGVAVLYPMFAPNRRQERRVDVMNSVISNGFALNDIIDLSAAENTGKFLEGTGSMVLDRVNHIAYAALSKRTHKKVLNEFCAAFRYKPLVFKALQTVDGQRAPIYHTNVMMSVGEGFAVVCLQSIDDKNERSNVENELLLSKKEIIEISEEQMLNFAGNMLQIENTRGEKLIVMSKTAHQSLDASQLERLQKHGKILSVAIPTIEKHGGGSVRCMLAEVFK
ncbi:MAG: amidinotransferase [Prevotellaceae bacterium]|nr:amidinotransferase [Prevotellaceae bacterium]